MARRRMDTPSQPKRRRASSARSATMAGGVSAVRAHETRIGKGLRSWLPRRRRRLGYTVVDVETTGLSPYRDRILEIALVRTDLAGRVLDSWTTLINPLRPVGPADIHGITDAEVRTAPVFVDVIGEVTK